MTAGKSAEPYLPARAKLWIGSLDEPRLEVQAQYNPKDLQIDKQIPWKAHNERDNRPTGKRPKKTDAAQADLEFNGASTRSMSVELLFDGYETGTSVELKVRALEFMSSVIDVDDPGKKRPHHCVVAWGDQSSGMRPFRCVIESLVTKYQVWDRNGVPLRATCIVKLQEADFMGRLRGDEKTSYALRDRDDYSDHEKALQKDVQRRQEEEAKRLRRQEQEREEALQEQARLKAQEKERVAAKRKDATQKAGGPTR